MGGLLENIFLISFKYLEVDFLKHDDIWECLIYSSDESMRSFVSKYHGLVFFQLPIYSLIYFLSNFKLFATECRTFDLI